MFEIAIVTVVVLSAVIFFGLRTVRGIRRAGEPTRSAGCSGCTAECDCPTTGHRALPLLAFVAFLAPLSAQAVGGISGTKIVTPNAHPVPEAVLELEPYFGIGWSRSVFDERWQRRNSDERTTATETGFRFTAGLSPSVELGLMLPVMLLRESGPDDRTTGADLGDIPVGIKWRFYSTDTLSLALTGGVTAPTGSFEPVPGELATGDGLVAFESGAIATWQITNELSIDADVVAGIGVGVHDNPNEWGAAVDVAVGYQWPQLQPVVELNYATGGNGDSHVISVTAGFTYNLSERVIIVTGVQADLFGRGEAAGVSYGLAFTTSI